MNNLKTTALLALTGFALITQPARAATLNWTDGDVFLAFRANGQTSDTDSASKGLGKTYVINLGSADQFNHTFTLSLGSIGIDLNAVFGSNWFTHRADGSVGGLGSDVLWSVVGTDNGGGLSNYSGNPQEMFVGKASTTIPWNKGSDQSLSSQDAAGMGFNGFAGNSSTANSNVAMIQSGATGSKYAAYLPANGDAVAGNAQGASNGLAFGSYSGQQFEAKDYNPLYLYALEDLGSTGGSAGPGQLLGNFTVASSGATNASVTFHAVPEPSTYAMIGLGAVVLLMAVRRQRNTVQA